MKIRLRKKYYIDLRAKRIMMLSIYVICLHILFLFIYKTTFASSYGSKLFIFSFNSSKYLFSLAETYVICRLILKRSSLDYLTETAVQILDLLYFIPGFIQQAVTDTDWKYMFFFLLFRLFVELFLHVLRPVTGKETGIRYRPRINDGMLYVISFFAILITFALAIYTKTFISISRIASTLNDVYEVRSESKSKAIHWAILSLEYWAAYFMITMIAFFTAKRKWWMVIILLLAETNLFLIQANRILLFLSAAAIIFGLIKLNNRKMICWFALFGIVLLVDGIVSERGLIVTDVFRRYSIVPNRLSEQYFDFFLTHEPDFLRSKYVRIAKRLSLQSPYESPSISQIIGTTYYNTNMNANNGLVGGAVFGFGYLGTVFSGFGLVMALRLFERATKHYQNSSMIVTVAFILCSLVINAPYPLANVFSLSYYFLLLLSLFLINCAYANKDFFKENDHV